MHDDDAVAREMDIQLEPVRAERQPVLERGDGVLRPQCGASAVGVDERTGKNRWRQECDCNSR
jgi:hypothetical protein